MKKSKNNSEVTCEIKKIYAVLSETQYAKKIFASISWNGGEAKDEIRSVIKTEFGERVVKGIGLTEEEQEILITACKKLKKKREKNQEDSAPTRLSVDAPKGVDLNEIFASADDIIHKRAEGNLTQDGFIILERVSE